jgi:hypothetical protein
MWSQPKREALWAAHGKAIVVGLPKPIGAHITSKILDIEL